MSLPTKPPTPPKSSTSDTAPKAPPVPAKPKTPRDGTRPHDNPGAVVYETGGKTSGRMIRVSKILTRYHQELEVQEDEPGESLLLRPNPQG